MVLKMIKSREDNGILVGLVREIWRFKLFAGKEVTPRYEEGSWWQIRAGKKVSVIFRAKDLVDLSQIHNIHYFDVIMTAMAYQITSLTIVYSSVYSGADQRKHQSSASLAFVRGIHR